MRGLVDASVLKGFGGIIGFSADIKKSLVNDRPSPFSGPGLSIAVTVSGGSDLYGLLSRPVGPQIRGSESVVMLRLAPRPVEYPDDRFDLLAGLD